MTENFLKVLTVVLFVPLVGSVISYMRGNHKISMTLNATVPLLLFVSSVVASLISPDPKLSVGGMFYFIVPVVIIFACLAGLRFPKLYSIIFYLVTAFNFLILSGLFYLVFLWRIQF